MVNEKRGKNRKVRIEQVYERRNLERADKEARRGKRWRRGVKSFDSDRERKIDELQEQLREQTFHTSSGEDVSQLCPCGKVRVLHKLPYYPDHIEHHALMQVVMPTMIRYYYRDSSASIPGRGMHYAAQRTRHYIDCHKYAGRLYYAKLDFVKFYHNIDQRACYETLKPVFGNEGIRYLLLETITACDRGLGIGLYPIQPIANFYTSPLCRELMRRFDVFVEIYCDDIVIISTDKKEVWKAVNFVNSYAASTMRQPLHTNIGVQIIDERHFLDFVGYRFYMNHTLLRKRMKIRFKQKAHRLKDPERRYRTLVSYRGWLMHCDGFNLWRRVTGMLSFKELKMPRVERRDRQVHRILDGIKVSIASLVGREIEFHDVEYGLMSRYKPKEDEEPRECAAVQVMDGGRKLKFITSAPGILDALRYAQEQGAFPIKGTIVSRQDGNFTVYEIE